MDIKLLFTFRMVATLGSFSKAAEMLDHAQSTISAQIQTLETYLGIKLFNRVGKQISLSPAGEQFLLYAQKMISLEEEVLTVVRNGEEVHGSLSMRICEPIGTYYLPALLKKYHDEFPHVKFNINSCSPYGLYEELRSARIDLACLITKDFKHADLDTLDLAEIPLLMVTYPDNPLAKKDRVHPIDLKDEPIFVPTGYCIFFTILENFFIDDKMPMSNVHYLTGIETIKQNIGAGSGTALLPRTAVDEELSKGLLVEIPFEKCPVSTHITLIWVKNKRLPPIVEAFIEMAEEYFSSANRDIPFR